MQLQDIFKKQQDFFFSKKTLNLQFRINTLNKIEHLIKTHEKDIFEALYLDLKKPKHEVLLTEYSTILEHIRYIKKKLAKWIRPEKVKTPLTLLPAKSYIHHVPLGVTLIISPWNYPFQLALAPLIGSIAAGNCTIIKPSEISSNTSKLIKKIFTSSFSDEYIAIIEGGIPETAELLKLKFNHIFFTGSTAVGKIVMKAAAENLTSITLELGGKSPVIVTPNADLDLAARRIIWGKTMNCGQTCVAPDYLYVHTSIKEKLITILKDEIKRCFGDNIITSDSFSRIINDSHFDRLISLIHNEKVIYGGISNKTELFISPTLLDNITWDDPIMKEEIFGPILPILDYSDIRLVYQEIESRPTPLSAYIFSDNNKEQTDFIANTHFGGGCINDVIAHLGSPYLPFGGVGASGLGSYHGKNSFLTFSHSKSVLIRSKLLDIKARYAPYNESKTSMLRKIFKI